MHRCLIKLNIQFQINRRCRLRRHEGFREDERCQSSSANALPENNLFEDIGSVLSVPSKYEGATSVPNSAGSWKEYYKKS